MPHPRRSTGGTWQARRATASGGRGPPRVVESVVSREPLGCWPVSCGSAEAVRHSVSGSDQWRAPRSHSKLRLAVAADKADISAAPRRLCGTMGLMWDKYEKAPPRNTGEAPSSSSRDGGIRRVRPARAGVREAHERSERGRSPRELNPRPPGPHAYRQRSELRHCVVITRCFGHQCRSRDPDDQPQCREKLTAKFTTRDLLNSPGSRACTEPRP